MLFQVLSSRHIETVTNPKTNQREDKVYNAGDVVDSPLALDKMYANKFKRVSKETMSEPLIKRKKKESLEDAQVLRDNEEEKLDPETAPDDDGGFDDEVEDEKPAAPDYGKEVSPQPPMAKKKGLKVFNNGETFAVFDEDRPGEPIKANLVDKAAVQKFLKEFE